MQTVSVIIPTYNRAESVQRAIDSVLNQTHNRFELFVVDDASTDNTAEVVKSYTDNRVTYIGLEENQGGSHARNVGIERASGEYLALLDDDDEWHRQKLERQLKTFNNLTEKYIGVYTDVKIKRRSTLKRMFDMLNPDEPHPTGDDAVAGSLLTMTGLVHGGSTLLLKRKAVEEIGGFDEEFPRNQDIEFCVRLTDVGKFEYLDEQLVTLYDTPGKKANDIVDSQELLMERFNDRIAELEQQGYNITSAHELYIARKKIRQGDLRGGLPHLQRSRIGNFRQGAGLAADTMAGLRATVVGGNR